MGLALQCYVNDHDHNYPPYVNPYDISLSNEIGAANTRYWWAKLLPYYPLKWTNEAYHCPGYNGTIAGENTPSPPYGSYAYNESGVSFPRHGYPYKPYLGLGPWNGQFATDDTPRPYSTAEARVKVPSEMLAVSESRFVSLKVNGIARGEDGLRCGLLAVTPIPDKEFAFEANRHGETYNALFCDGHILAIDPWVLFNPTNTAAMWNYDHQPHPECWVP